MVVRFAKDAQKTLESYDRTTKQRIRAGIRGLTLNPPLGDIKRMSGYSDGRLRLRVGGYRVVFRYDRNGDLEVLQVISIDARGGVYKQRR